MPLAISNKTNVPYVLKADRQLPKEKQTTFWLRTMRSHQRLQIQDLIRITDGVVGAPIGTGTWLIVKAGLTGWDNLLFEDGTPAKFEAEEGARVIQGVEIHNPVKDECIDLLSPEDLAELRSAIVDLSQLTRADVKN